MDNLSVALRILHIVFGVLLVGNVFFLTLFLEPRLRTLGPAIQNPVLGALMPIVTPVQLGSFAIVLGSGVWMTLDMRWGSLGSFLASGWGWTILVGFLATIAAGIVGFGYITPAGTRLGKLARGIQGRPPTPDEARQLGRFASRIQTLSRVNVALGLIILVAMAVARFV